MNILRKLQLGVRRDRPWLSRAVLGLLAIGTFALSTGCNRNAASTPQPATKDAATTDSSQGAGLADRQIMIDFADQVVVPTYQLLVDRANELSSAVGAVVNEPSQTTLQAAQSAWLAARQPWEQSEAFIVGPVEASDYDASLDAWPVNETDLKTAIAGHSTFTPDLMQNLRTTQKGFHAIEYLLFGPDNTRQISDLSEQDLQYLQALANDFNQTAKALYRSWVEGTDDTLPYREVLATAGMNENSEYPTVQSGAEQMVLGILDCLDQVANVNIGEPLATQETAGLESRFSHSTLQDFENNLKSVKNAYLGEVPDAGTQGRSLSDAIAQVNPELDTQIQQEIEAALKAIVAIPAPLEVTLAQPETAARLAAAKTAILQLHSTLEQRVLPLVQG